MTFVNMGVSKWVYSGRLFNVSVRTNKRHISIWSGQLNFLPVANSALVAYSDPLRGKQQGLGTKLSHARNRGRPSCACAWPAKHNRDWWGEDYSHPTPREWFPRAPKLKPGTTRNRGDELDRGCDRALNNPADQGYVVRSHAQAQLGRPRFCA